MSETYSSVKLNNGHLIDRIKNYQQNDWIVACKRLGLNVQIANGRGSHVAVYKAGTAISDKNSLVATLTHKMFPNIQRDIFKKILAYGIESGLYSEDDVWKALGVKK